MRSASAYRITGVGSEPNAPVWIATTAERAEEALRVAQGWSDSGVRDIAIVEAEGHRLDLPALDRAEPGWSPSAASSSRHGRYLVVELALRAGCDLTEAQRCFLDEISARFRAEA